MENEVVNLASMKGSVDFSMFSMFFKSDWIVKFVILLLVVFSIQSWKIIIQKILTISKMKRISKKFENHFWSGVTLDELHEQIEDFEEESFSTTFKNIMDEYDKSIKSKAKMDSFLVQRLETVLELSVSNEDSKLNGGLSFLASSGSVAPFIGLFGTVWGIMQSFQAKAIAQNTNLAVVAPGIAEALFVTALGLFVAIPSTAFYNLITARIDSYLSEVENFGKDLVNIISRQMS
jgi:biopolymer transport protein TolQ